MQAEGHHGLQRFSQASWASFSGLRWFWWALLASIRLMAPRSVAPVVLLLLLGGGVAAFEVDAEEPAEGQLQQPFLDSAASENILNACSMGAAGVGAALCMKASTLLAGGGYLAAGASGMLVAAARRKARIFKREASALTASQKEMEKELAVLREATREMHDASGEIASGLGTLWKAMTGAKEQRLASSLSRDERLELLTLIRTAARAEAGPGASDGSLIAAEEYLLRHFPQVCAHVMEHSPAYAH